MKIAEPRDVGDKQQQKQPEAKYPRIFESDKDSTLHVLYVAALAGFVVWVIAEGVKFSDSQSLALTVFFIVSIAGAVLGGARDSAARRDNKPQVAAQTEIPAAPAGPADRNGPELQPKPALEAPPKPSLETVMETQ